MNIAELCFNKRTIVVCLAAALTVAGIRGYFGIVMLEVP